MADGFASKAKSGFKRAGHFTFAHLVGLGLIVLGWLIPILGTGMDRFSSTMVLTTTNYVGLGIIILGAYFPEIWLWFTNRDKD